MAKVTLAIEFSIDGESVPIEIMQFLERMAEPNVIEIREKHETDIQVSPAQLQFVERLVGNRARLPVANGQKGLIKALIDVEWDEGLSRQELLRRLGRDNRELSGLLGAFGKRINGTEGYESEDVKDGPLPMNAVVYAQKEGKWCYRLKLWFRQALNILYEQGQIEWLRDDKQY